MKRMKKTRLLFVVLLLFVSVTPALACWRAPEPFEIFSDDGSKVFVFTPSEDSSRANAYAALYEIINNERQLVYAVENLSSFAYESNFHFSADMMHFARVFPPWGMDTFEVFSYGIRTRVVLRSDFIEDYASTEAFTSIGPSYTVTWRIDEHTSQDATITIRTDEGIVYFDLAAARFDWETVLPAYYETPPTPIQVQYSPLAFFETPSDISSTPIAQTQNPPIVLFVIVGAAVISITAGMFLLKKRKMEE